MENERFSSSEMLKDKQNTISYCDKQIAQFDKFIETATSVTIVKDEYAKLFIGEFKDLVVDLKGIYETERESLRTIDEENIATEENREILFTLVNKYRKLQGFVNEVMEVYNKFLDRSLELSPYMPFRLGLEKLKYADAVVAKTLNLVKSGKYDELLISGTSMVEEIRGLNKQFEAYKNGKQIFAHDYVPEEK